MIDILLFAINSVMPIIALVALGYFLKKAGFFTKEFLKIGNKTVYKVLLPALLFINIAEMDDFSEINKSAILYAMFAIAILILFGLLVAKNVTDKKQKGVMLQCVFRSNFALIGVPLAQLMAGQDGVRNAAIMSAFSIPVFNIISVIALTAFVSGEEETTLPKKIKKIVMGILKNPLLIAVFSGVAFVFVKILFFKLPQSVVDGVYTFRFIWTTIEYLSKASTPVALLVLGGQFEFDRISGYKRQIIIGCVGRLIGGPVIGIGGAVVLQILGVLHFSPGVFAAYVALFGTPVAVASAIMAEEMDNDGALARQLVVWTTLFSTISIFLTVMVLSGLKFL